MSRPVELNIGLVQSQRFGRGVGTVDVGDAILRLQPLAFGGVLECRISMAGAEPTLIVRFVPNVPDVSLYNAIRRLSEALLQDCIALYQPPMQGTGGHGFLLGPHAAECGAFDRAFFQRL